MFKQHLKNFFIPHADNNYHPHLLHTKRAVLYSSFFFVTKILVIGTALLLPTAVFVSPDILAKEQQQLVALTNAVRSANGVPVLTEEGHLDRSAALKTQDMINDSYFGHRGPDGHDLAYFLSTAGYPYKTAGENLAMGYERAEDIFAAWLASPAHYQNIVDPDFQELGIDLKGGIYNGQTVVFAASHFGAPDVPASARHIAQANDVFRGQIYELSASRRAAVHLDSSQSFVRATAQGDKTRLQVQAVITGGVRGALVSVAGKDIPLALKPGTFETYVGEAVVDTAYDDLFSTVSAPTVSIAGQNGDIIQQTIAWKDAPAPTSSWLDRYQRAKALLSDMPIFSTSTFLYLAFAFLFAMALLLKVFVNMHRQHAHIIVQTLCLIFFLVTLALV